jgi:predicted transposase/invertase (TIGR01784 family)
VFPFSAADHPRACGVARKKGLSQSFGMDNPFVRPSILPEPTAGVREMVARLVQKTRAEFTNSERAAQAIQLVEELLMRRFAKLGREEIRAMFHLEDIRKTRVWQEAHEEGREEGRQEGREEGRQEGREEGRQELVHRLLPKGLAIKEIAALLDASVQEVRRLSKNGRH